MRQKNELPQVSVIRLNHTVGLSVIPSWTHPSKSRRSTLTWKDSASTWRRWIYVRGRTALFMLTLGQDQMPRRSRKYLNKYKWMWKMDSILSSTLCVEDVLQAYKPVGISGFSTRFKEETQKHKKEENHWGIWAKQSFGRISSLNFNCAELIGGNFCPWQKQPLFH